MANIKFTNFARSKLAVGVGTGDTTMSITGATGALFPALTAGQYFYATLENATLDREIVKVTARAADTFTVARAQDNTTARAWVAGDIVSLRFNALAITESIGNAVQQTSAVGAALIPAGTTAERPSPAFGHQRANSTTGLMEWWNGTIWTQMGGGATGSGGDQVFYENDTVVNTNHTISRNSHTVGPLEIASGKTLTINSGKRLVVL